MTDTTQQDVKPQEPTKFPMTMNAARAIVARSCAATIARSIEDLRALETKTAAEAQDKQSLVTAAQELFNTLIQQARRFDRPLILRPERRIKVVR
jgi:hypothetical protein